jgi:hypothetical protein
VFKTCVRLAIKTVYKAETCHMHKESRGEKNGSWKKKWESWGGCVGDEKGQD